MLRHPPPPVPRCPPAAGPWPPLECRPALYAPAPPLARYVAGPLAGRPRALADFLDEALAHLASAAGPALINCSWDPTLPATGAPAGRAALASNLRNAAGVAPNMVLQLLRLALWLPEGRAFVVIFEDGSADATRHWLGLLQLLLAPLGVPARVTLAGGALAQRPGEGRIPHLARLRNALVQPFYPPARGARDAARCGARRVSGAAGGARGGAARARSPGAAGLPAACFEPEAFLFVNDVFFCAADAARLLLQTDADLACGYDVTGGSRRRSRRQRRLHWQRGGGLEQHPAAPLNASQQGAAAGDGGGDYEGDEGDLQQPGGQRQQRGWELEHRRQGRRLEQGVEDEQQREVGPGKQQQVGQAREQEQESEKEQEQEQEQKQHQQQDPAHPAQGQDEQAGGQQLGGEKGREEQSKGLFSTYWFYGEQGLPLLLLQ
jgi:hypothetical protein